MSAAPEPPRYRFPPPPRLIRTPRLRLRAWQRDDAPGLLAAIDASLDALRTWTPWVIPEPYDVATLEVRIEHFERNFENRVAFAYAVLDDDGVVIGHGGLFGRVAPDTLEAGYFIRSDRTGRGYATEAARAFVDAAFAHCGAARVEMHCDEENHASIAVPLKLGMVADRRIAADDGRTLVVYAITR